MEAPGGLRFWNKLFPVLVQRGMFVIDPVLVHALVQPVVRAFQSSPHLAQPGSVGWSGCKYIQIGHRPFNLG